jgi:hypothetical protein
VFVNAPQLNAMFRLVELRRSDGPVCKRYEIGVVSLHLETRPAILGATHT